MKKILTFMVFTNFLHLSAQVGINTNVPVTTLDVVGKPDVITSLDGVIAPRMSGDQLRQKNYLVAQQGALVYITSASSVLTGQVVNVVGSGYYYFDGSLWVALKPAAAAVTNVISNSINTISSTVNGVNSTTLAINSNVLSKPTNNTIRSTINGVVSTTDPTIVASVGNAVTGNTINTNVNGVIGTAVTIPNIYTNDGALTGDRIITQGNNTLSFNTTIAGGTKLISNGSTVAQKSAVQIIDGGQANGKYLMSDASGNATWQDARLTSVPGAFYTGGAIVIPANNNATCTGASIKLPPGKWMIHLGSTVSTSTNTSTPLTAGSIWVTFTIQDSCSGSVEATTSDHIAAYSGQRAGGGTINIGGFKTFVSGSFAVNNQSTADKTYYVWIQQERTGVAPNTATVAGAFAGSWEKHLYAIPIK